MKKILSFEVLCQHANFLEKYHVALPHDATWKYGYTVASCRSTVGKWLVLSWKHDMMKHGIPLDKIDELVVQVGLIKFYHVIGQGDVAVVTCGPIRGWHMSIPGWPTKLQGYDKRWKWQTWFELTTFGHTIQWLHQHAIQIFLVRYVAGNYYIDTLFGVWGKGQTDRRQTWRTFSPTL